MPLLPTPCVITALLFDLPEPVGFLDVRVRRCWLRYQLGTFLAEVFETARELFPGECVLVVRQIRYGRREILKHRPKPDGRTEMAASAGLRRARHHADGIADHQPGFADRLRIAVPRRCERCSDERKDVRRCQRVEATEMKEAAN
jgi:hypothetical protein